MHRYTSVVFDGKVANFIQDIRALSHSYRNTYVKWTHRLEVAMGSTCFLYISTITQPCIMQIYVCNSRQLFAFNWKHSLSIIHQFEPSATFKSVEGKMLPLLRHLVRECLLSSRAKSVCDERWRRNVKFFVLVSNGHIMQIIMNINGLVTKGSRTSSLLLKRGLNIFA